MNKSLIYVYHPETHECIDIINSRQYLQKREEIAQYYQRGYFVDTPEFSHNDRISYKHLSVDRPIQKIVRILKENHLDEETDVFLVRIGPPWGGRRTPPKGVESV